MDLNLYRKKIDLDRAMNGKAVSGQKFEVFGVHSGGYFTREPLCADHLHETILDACVCANIKSARQDMEKYGVEVEIVQLSGTTDFFKSKNLRVMTKEQIVRTFNTDTTQATLSYRAFNGYGSCLHNHSTITKAAICADAYVIDRGYAPCGSCSKELGAAIFSQTPCFKHQQTAGVEEISGRPLGTQEIYLGIQLEALSTSDTKPLPNSNIKPVEVQPDIQPQPDIESEERRTRRKQCRGA